jgi:hypothetical protein
MPADRLYAVAVLLLSALPCAAQPTAVESWRKLFAEGYSDVQSLEAAEGTAADDTIPKLGAWNLYFGRCEVAAPDSVVLVGRSNYTRGENDWWNTPSFGRLGPPLNADTLKVRVLRTICGSAASEKWRQKSEPKSFVLEYAGKYVRMPIPAQPQRGMLWILAEAENGQLLDLRWSPVARRIESFAQAKERWTAARWRERAINSVLSNQLYIGMSAEMVREAWGEPADINQTIGRSGALEQWVYGRGLYVYVANGQVTALQNIETGRH